SCCFWHPYHLWCIREATPGERDLLVCADCGEDLDAAAVRATLGWTAASVHHVHARTINATPPLGVVREQPDAYAGRRRGRRAVAIAAGRDAKGSQRLELVHEDCGHDAWTRRLAAAPGDDELRLVYADWLEQAGDLRRASFVRVAARSPAVT